MAAAKTFRKLVRDDGAVTAAQPDGQVGSLGPHVGPAFGPIEYRAIGELMPYAKNARTHDADQLADLERSMTEFGWTIPVLVDETGTILAGHARIQVGAKIGITSAPVLVARGWSEGKKKAYILADNKLTERGGWNWKLVSAELHDIRDLGVDVMLSGFETFELEPLMGADWTPPPPRNETGEAMGSRSIMFSQEQYRKIVAGAKRYRTAEQKGELSDAEIITALAEGVE
jgi:hypothetical protein